MAKSLLVITQNVDERDDLLGFFPAWLKQFSRHFERVDVVTLSTGTFHLPTSVHVHSLGKECGASKWRQAARCVRLLWRYTPRGGSVFCHMSPIFAIVAWPFARLRSSRLVLWYLHRSRTLRLRLALALCDTLVTADAASLTIDSSKIVAVGHGIDVHRFLSPIRLYDISYRRMHIVSVGRLAPIKDFSTIILAMKLLRDRGKDVQLRIVGRAILPEHHREEARLHALVRELGIDDLVSFVGFVPYRDMAAQYAWADVIVGGTPRGGLDKALLEAMAAGCIALTTNDVMRRYLEPYANRLVVPHGDASALAAAVASLDDWPAMSAAMIASVRRHHDVATTVARIAKLI